MCIVLSGQDGVVEQARRQLEDLVPVWAVLDYTETRTISRELMLCKISVLGPEYLEDQLQGGPTHEPQRDKLQREVNLAQSFERSGQSDRPASPAPASDLPKPLTHSEALFLKAKHLHAIHMLAIQFGAKIVDVSEHSVIVELAAKSSRVDAFLALVKPFGILESARTGVMVMPRTPLSNTGEEDEDDAAASLAAATGGGVDPTMLPPG
jgi:acetolactate synthase-1/3 small subunit